MSLSTARVCSPWQTPAPEPTGAQFFITTVPTPWLHMHHTIFGEVAEGMDAVGKIENSPTGYMDKPVEAQKINSVTVE